MFQLSLVDHIRLSFGAIVSAYEGHSDAAARLARWSWGAKVGILALLGITAGVSVGAVMRGGIYTMASATLSAIAFAAAAAFVAFDPETRVYGHRTTAARLWVICEKYRALLAEIHDQLLDLPAVAQRRDALLKEAAELFVQAPPADRATYEIARKTLGQVYSDQEVDRFLPLSLRRPTGATT